MKYFKIILLAVLIGFFCTLFVIKGYSSDKIISVGEKVYFFQYGVYSNIESLEKNTLGLDKYIYNINNNLYHVYIGITKNNVEKLTNYFKSKNYNIYIKEIEIKDNKFLELLNTYDKLIEKTDDKTSIKVIQNKILESYKEVN